MEDFLVFKNPCKRHIQRKLLGRAIRNLCRYRKSLTVVCLPGESAWDIKYFLGFKDVAKIIAIESDDIVFNKLKVKFNGFDRVKLVNKTTTEFFYNSEENSFDIVYLDYFSNFSSSVKFDLRLLFERSLLREKGKVCIGFYGARESKSSFYENFYYCKKFCERFDQRPPNKENLDLIRPLSFNAFIWSLRATSRARITSPAWFRYETKKCWMYVGLFSYNGETKRRGSVHCAIKYSLSRWFNLKPREVRKSVFVAGNIKKFHPNGRRDLYKHYIIKFYEKYHRSPQKWEVSKFSGYTLPKNINGFTELVRSCGLCPRINATKTELIQEIRRIYKRERYVSWKLLCTARISGRLSHLGYSQMIKEAGVDYGIRNKIYLTKKKIIHFRIVGEYLSHISSGKNKTKFQHYGTIRHKGLAVPGKARDFLNKEKKELSKLDLTNSIYSDALNKDLSEIYSKKGISAFRPDECAIDLVRTARDYKITNSLLSL